MKNSDIDIKALKKELGIDTPKSAEEKTTAVRPKSILEAFEHIVELSEDSKFSKEFFAKASIYIKYAARKLNLTPMQVALLAQFIDRSESSIRLSEIASHTGCSTTRILQLSNDVDVLEQLHYVRASRSNRQLSYRVPGEVLTALKANKPYIYEPVHVADTSDFFDQFDKLSDEKDEDELTYDSFKAMTMEMLKEIENTVFAREIRRYQPALDEDDTMLFIFMANLYVQNNDDNIGFHDIDNLYDNDEIPRWLKRMLRDRSLYLFDIKLIENAFEDGMARSDAFKLTEAAKQSMLSELNLSQMGKSDKNLIKADSLTEKRLIYNKEEQKQITELSSILTQDRFNGVQERLRKAGMRPGFCCIFYGAPGTGKTETVYQLARQTGRDIMRVDVDKIKSCWVGESEKNIKALFDRYRNICKSAKVAPILLFNEADAVLGVRMEGASRAVDKMENSIQNIILQEMETLEGIMIAITNLTTNLDKAFERRFLYKIRFDKPTVEARAEIWKAMLPNLEEKDARTLASAFDLSGGEIENIARKHSVAAILSGDDTIDINAIIETCRHERINNSGRHRIGF